MPLLVLSPTTFLPVLSLIITKSPFAMHVVIERRGFVGDNTNNGEDFKIQFFLSPSLPERDLG
jgi:hypothetical protein